MIFKPKRTISNVELTLKEYMPTFFCVFFEKKICIDFFVINCQKPVLSLANAGWKTSSGWFLKKSHLNKDLKECINFWRQILFFCVQKYSYKEIKQILMQKTWQVHKNLYFYGWKIYLQFLDFRRYFKSSFISCLWGSGYNYISTNKGMGIRFLSTTSTSALQ